LTIRSVVESVVCETIIHKGYSFEEWENLPDEQRDRIRYADRYMKVWKIYHSHGGARGTPLSKEYVTYDRALSQHRAIMVNK